MSIDIHLYKDIYLDGHYVFEEIYEDNYKSTFQSIIEKALGYDIKRHNFYALLPGAERALLINEICNENNKLDDNHLKLMLNNFNRVLFCKDTLYLMID